MPLLESSSGNIPSCSWPNHSSEVVKWSSRGGEFVSVVKWWLQLIIISEWGSYVECMWQLPVYNWLSWVGCDLRQSCVLVARLYFSFCSDILGIAHAVLHQSIPCLLGIMIHMFVLVAEAVLTSILMSLFVEHAYGVLVLSNWTSTPQALQSLRAPAAMPDQCTIHAGTHSSDRLCSTSPWFKWFRGGQLHVKLNLKPGSYILYSQIPDVTVNRRNSITSWLYTHYILHYC